VRQPIEAIGRAAVALLTGQIEGAAVQAEEAGGEALQHVPGRRGVRFVHESWAELRKVDWPGQSQVVQATTVVLLACAIVGAYLWGADLVLKRLVEKVFLGQ